MPKLPWLCHIIHFLKTEYFKVYFICTGYMKPGIFLSDRSRVWVGVWGGSGHVRTNLSWQGDGRLFSHLSLVTEEYFVTGVTFVDAPPFVIISIQLQYNANLKTVSDISVGHWYFCNLESLSSCSMRLNWWCVVIYLRLCLQWLPLFLHETVTEAANQNATTEKFCLLFSSLVKVIAITL